MIAAFRKQQRFIVEDLRIGASLRVTAKRFDVVDGLLVAILIDNGLLVLRTDNGETVRVTR